MNVLFVIPTLGQGGAQRVLVDLANSLASGEVSSSHCDEPGEQFRVSIVTFVSSDRVPHHKPCPSIRVYYLGVISGTRTPLGAIISCVRRLRATIDDAKPDVVVSFQDIANFPTTLACIRKKVRLIVSERQDTRYYRAAHVRGILRKLLYRFANLVVVQTDLVKHQMPTGVICRTVVVPNSSPRYRPGTFVGDGADRTIQEVISVGRLENQKNFSLLVDAASTILKYRDDWMLTIYGEGSLRGKLENQIRNLDMESKITLPGTDTDIFRKMSAADIFVLPSLYEGFPNVLAEAASIGLPCIGYSDVSGVPDLIENGVSGILLSSEQRRPADLASAIESLMNNADKRAKMGRAGSVRSERFNHFCVARQWIDVIAGAGDVVSDSPSL